MATTTATKTEEKKFACAGCGREIPDSQDWKSCHKEKRFCPKCGWHCWEGEVLEPEEPEHDECEECPYMGGLDD